jgi:hypothetical protein
LNLWLAGIGNDPATLNNGPNVLQSLRSYSDVAFGAAEFSKALEGLAHWLQSNRPPTALPSVVRALISSLTPFSNGNPKVKTGVGSFARDAARWLGGSSRLEVLVDVLSEVGLTEEELDQVFPTFRIHVYHDTGFRQVVEDGTERPVLKPQSSFGLYVYHEGSLQGWETAIEGAQRIEENLYLISIPNNGTTKIKIKVQAVEEENDRRLPEDPIKPRDYPKPAGTGPGVNEDTRKGCLHALLKLFGL